MASVPPEWSAALTAADRPVFGVAGSSAFVMLAQFVQAGGDYVATQHEAGAVAMATGWAWATGRAGIASVHQGPGLTNALTAIVDADRFGVGRSTDAERDAFDALAREAGLDVEPLGLVSNMRFVRLTRKAGAPARRPAAAAKRAPVAP